MNEATSKTSTITVRQLRVILFELDDQKMTIEQLRKKLYDMEEQDRAVEINSAIWWNLGVQS